MAKSNDLSRNLFSYFFVFRYSCDLRVVGLLRQRTLGNSSTKVCNQVGEQPSEFYTKRLLRFLQARPGSHFMSNLQVAYSLLLLPERTERRCCYAYNQERIGLALQTTHTGSGGNNSSHQRSNRLVFFWQRKGYHEYTPAEKNINPADMVGAETAHFMHTGRRWPFHSIVHPDWYIKEGWCWAPHLQVCLRVNIIGVIPLTHWSLHFR